MKQGMFFRTYLGWSLKHVARNYLFIAISRCCVQKYLLLIGPKCYKGLIVTLPF